VHRKYGHLQLLVQVAGLPGERIGYLALSPQLPDAAALRGACAFANRILAL